MTARPIPGETATLAAIAREEYDARRRRDQLLGVDLSAEPGWDMLLDLYVEHDRGQPVELARLHATLPVALTTALRWIGLLIDAGLVKQRRAEDNRDRIELELTTRGTETLEAYLRDRLERRAAPTGAAS